MQSGLFQPYEYMVPSPVIKRGRTTLVLGNRVLPSGQCALFSETIVVKVFGTFDVSFIKQIVQGITKMASSSMPRG